MTTTFCSRCGFKQQPKSKCLWCFGTHDESFDFTDEQTRGMHKSFGKLDMWQRKMRVIALGLEGFTPLEIHSITNADLLGIEEVLESAGIYLGKKK
jgi:hypothetical protein